MVRRGAKGGTSVVKRLSTLIVKKLGQRALAGMVIAGLITMPVTILAKEINVQLDQPSVPGQSPSIELMTPGDSTTTYESFVMVRGIVRSAERLQVNGQEVPIGNAGEFETRVPLPKPGLFMIQIDALRKNGEKDSVIRSVKRLTKEAGDNEVQNPELTILEPPHAFTTSKSKVLVKGLAKGATRVEVNNNPVEIGDGGRFSTKVPLVLGENTVHVTAYKADGTFTEALRTLTYSTIAPGQEDLGKKYISLNVIDTDIQDIIPIMTEKTGLNFIGDKSMVGHITIHLKDVELDKALDLILKANGYDYERIGNTIFIAPRANLASFKTLLIQVYQLKNVKSADAMNILKNFISSDQGESIQESADENMLIIKAMQSTFERLESILEQIDRSKPQQVIIEVKVAEISRSKLDKLGLKIDTSGLKTTYTVPLQAPIHEATLSNIGLAANLDATFEQANAHVLATPRLSALNNKEASIFIGDEVPYVNTSTSASGGTTSEVETVEVGVRLKMTPLINPVDSSITVQISTEVSFISGYISNIPQVQTREASTTLRINDGETAVIGGLLSSTDTVTKTGLPLLGQLPVIGSFFASTVEDKDERELIITITPQIINI